jgi:hypothetical protein
MTGASRARPGDRPCIPDVGRTKLEGRMRQKILAVAVVVLLAGQVAAQVDPADYADSGGAPKGAWDVKESPAPRGPQVNCSGAWTAWGACSPAAKQWRFFEPTRWAENGGRACPQPLAAEQSCEYPGQRLLYASGDAAALWRPQCASSDGACQFPLIRAAVGDLIVFVSPDGAPGVSRLASTWHHAECDFAGAETVDAKPVVTSGGVSVPALATLPLVVVLGRTGRRGRGRCARSSAGLAARMLCCGRSSSPACTSTRSRRPIAAGQST